MRGEGEGMERLCMNCEFWKASQKIPGLGRCLAPALQILRLLTADNDGAQCPEFKPLSAPAAGGES